MEDVGDTLGALLDSAVTGVVNIASGSAVAVREIVRRIGEKTGREDLLDFGAIAANPGEAEVVEASVKPLAVEVR